MQFAIDATPILPGRKGLGIFLEQVIHQIHLRFQVSPLIYVDTCFFSEAKKRWPSLTFRSVWAKPSSFWEKYGLPLCIRKDKVSILFTGRDRTLLEPLCRTVVYLFEIPDYRQNALLNGNASWYEKVSIRISRKQFQKTTRSVTKFITSSFSTQKDLEFRYQVAANRIATVYPGVDPVFQPAADHNQRMRARQRFAKGQKYVLHFATGDVRDNTEVALRAFQDSLTSIPKDIHLLLAGVPLSIESVLNQEVKKFGLKDRISTVRFLRGNDLVMAYQGAEAYLDPTLYEGFGFQNLEAMACGVPVISSSVTSVPEIVGQAGLLYSPDDISGFSAGLRSILNNPKIAEELKKKGLEQAKQFTWSWCTDRILSVIEEELCKGSVIARSPKGDEAIPSEIASATFGTLPRNDEGFNR